MSLIIKWTMGNKIQNALSQHGKVDGKSTSECLKAKVNDVTDKVFKGSMFSFFFSKDTHRKAVKSVLKERIVLPLKADKLDALLRKADELNISSGGDPKAFATIVNTLHQKFPLFKRYEIQAILFNQQRMTGSSHELRNFVAPLDKKTSTISDKIGFINQMHREGKQRYREVTEAFNRKNAEIAKQLKVSPDRVAKLIEEKLMKESFEKGLQNLKLKDLPTELRKSAYGQFDKYAKAWQFLNANTEGLKIILNKHATLEDLKGIESNFYKEFKGCFITCLEKGTLSEPLREELNKKYGFDSSRKSLEQIQYNFEFLEKLHPEIENEGKPQEMKLEYFLKLRGILHEIGQSNAFSDLFKTTLKGIEEQGGVDFKGFTPALGRERSFLNVNLSINGRDIFPVDEKGFTKNEILSQLPKEDKQLFLFLQECCSQTLPNKFAGEIYDKVETYLKTFNEGERKKAAPQKIRGVERHGATAALAAHLNAQNFLKDVSLEISKGKVIAVFTFDHLLTNINDPDDSSKQIARPEIQATLTLQKGIRGWKVEQTQFTTTL